MFVLLLGLLSLASVLAIGVAARRTLDLHPVSIRLFLHLTFCLMLAGAVWSQALAAFGLAPEVFGDDDIWWFVSAVLMGGVGLLGSMGTAVFLARSTFQLNTGRSPFMGLQLGWWVAHFFVVSGLSTLAGYTPY